MDDLPLRPSAPFDPTPPRRPRTWLAVPVILAIGGVLWYFAFLRPPAEERVAPGPQRISTPSAGAPRASAEPGEEIVLPPLDESDAIVRDLVAKLSSHPRVAAWLTTDGLIRNFAVTVVNIADGRTPAQHLKKVAPSGAFQVRQDGHRIYLDPRSYARYDGHAEAVGALDAQGTARLHATLKPRIEEANRELGTGADFDAVFERAIVSLLRTPVVEGDILLQADSVAYRFADPALESLTHAQRQLLRMGPRNQRIVQGKLREIARYLGIPDERLPRERVHSAASSSR